LAVLLAVVGAGICAGAQTATPPQLESRNSTTSPPAPDLDAAITAPVNIPTEAWGHYTFGHEFDLLEIDLEKRGMTGYITLMGGKGPDKNAPLTFFFSKTRVGGDHIYFATQEIHRVSYEFSGALQQESPPNGTLLVAFSLVGTLTTHHVNNNGIDKKESRQVIFKKVPERLR
jgi:hypothetical protein